MKIISELKVKIEIEKEVKVKIEVGSFVKFEIPDRNRTRSYKLALR